MLLDEYGKEEKEVLKLIFMVVRVHFAYEKVNGISGISGISGTLRYLGKTCNCR